MEVCNLINKIDVPTVDLKVEHIQELLVLVKAKSKSDLTVEFWEEAAQPLWHHLKHCLGNLDDQLLCATCFYSVIPLTSKKDQDHYMDKLLYLFGHESNSPSRFIRRSLPSSRQLPFGVKDLDTSATDDQIAQSTSTLRIVSLIYGMFQSSFLTNIKEEDVSKISLILKEIFNLLLPMGYEYSEYTFLVFKIMTMYKKVCGGPLETYIFNYENQLKLLALVNNNWENPVTGVRDLNRSIFQTLLSILDTVTYQRVRKDIEGFYWNKAKFLMVSDIIETQNENILWLMPQTWINGLIYSLHKPGLVSAGADMYYALLKKINHPDDWCQVFLVHVLKILSGSCIKAIDNFCNYWCLTTLKKFRTISEILIDELEKLNGSAQAFYSKLGIMKQSNKLGILDKNWSVASNNMSTRNSVLAGINLYNTQIRIFAFDIVCVSQGKSVPSLLEYDLIMDYLRDNLNSDSTVLRISMLGSLNYFLVHLHCTFKTVIMKTENSEALNNLLDFCKKLQNLIGNNIMVTGNYQRKITSVKLCDSILTSFSTITKKKGRRKADKGDNSVQHDSHTLIDFLKQHNCWLLSTREFVKKLISLLKDPADDVRDNVIKILLSYYTNELYDTLLQDIVNDAKTCVRSKFFYEIGCGLSMFKLIVNLLLKTKSHSQTEYKSVEDIFDFVFKELHTQHAAKTNVLNSIEQGQQLHSYLSILLVVLEGCNANSYTLKVLDDSKMSSLLQVLESVSNQFVWEEEGSSDFSEMNDMIQNIINTSDYNSLDDEDQAKISGLQQIVLNCLWLNVKASCDLAAMLIQYKVKDVSMCEGCLNIITRVLETSRHKGAIEAAGAALGRAIYYLTSLPEKATKISTSVDVSRLPFNLLKVKLNDLISETNKMSSVTRRGAGLSIMLHRIVSNDMKKGKPLFHYFLKILLNKCKHPKVLSSVDASNFTDENMENQVDLPAAIYIHFLTRIVTDSSLATDVMFYSTELAELAFGNLTSSHWQIRNAALQLYGALMPRLIGQKKASGTGDETISTVACDELLTHSPKLWKHIIEQLKQKEGDDLIQTHSNLVPILNILANCAKRYHFSLFPMEEDTEIADLFNHLMILLGSPIYTVRRLTAKAIFNIYEFEHISENILNQENVTENILHGMLLLLGLCANYYTTNVHYQNTFKKHREKFNEIFSTKPHSYMCKNLYENVFDNDVGMVDIEYTILELNGNVSPGIQIWAEARLRRYVNKCSWNDMPSLLNLLLQQCNHDNLVMAFFEFLLLRIEQETIDSNTLQQIANTLMSYKKTCCSSFIWKILYEISKKISLHHCIDIDQLIRDLNGRLYVQRYMVPLIAKEIEYVSNENKSLLLGIIQDMSDFEKSDVDMRHIAAVANNELSHNFNKLPDSLRVISIKCAVLLLQDEDEDIRNLSVNFYCAICRDERILQPYICLNKILDMSFLNSIFAEPQKAIVELKMKITDLLKLNHKVDEYNPFANDSKNIYFESHVLKDLVDKLNV